MPLPRKLSDINKVVIHCADTQNGDGRYTIEDVDKWHKKRGFSRSDRPCENFPYGHVGYHFVIHVDGTLGKGRKFTEIGAHASGHNSKSIGICLMGRTKFTAEQWEALTVLVKNLQSYFKNLCVVGHKDLSRKVCPGFDVFTWMHKNNYKPLAKHVFGDQNDKNPAA